MHQRMFRGRLRAALVIVILGLAAAAASAQACPSGTLTPGSTVGVTSCPQLSGPTFQQSGYCFYFPNGSSNTPATCDPAFCGQVNFLFPAAGTFTATLTYPAPNGFNLLGLQLCHDGQAVPDPANCPQTMAPGGTDAGCTMDITPGDNGTPLDATDDTMTTTLTCPIAAGDSLNQYTLIVYPLTVLNCTDVMDPFCAADFTQGVTAALQATFAGTVTTSPGPEGAKAEGGGELAPKQHFSLNAKNDVSKWDNAHVRYAIASNDPTKCKFEADGATYVDIEPTPFAKEGGSGLISGTGTVTDSLKIRHNVTYTLRINDGGKNGTDTFQLTAPGCDTNGLAVPVNHGNIVIHAGHDNH